MKKIFLLIALLVPLLTGCTAYVAGDFEDYNEICKGTIDLDMQGHGYAKGTTSPSDLSWKGYAWITYIPLSSYLTCRCKGQRGEAKFELSDGRIATGEWECDSCTSGHGTVKTNKNEIINFYMTMNKNKYESKLEEYKLNGKNKPSMKGNYSNKRNVMEDLF